VRIAQNGQEGLDAVLNDLPFNMILMDIQMPVMDGFESTRRIRLTPEGRGPVILAMTANVTPEDRARCRAAGMEDFVPKPIVPEHLYAVLGRWLRVVGVAPGDTADDVSEESPSAKARRRARAETSTLLYDTAMLEGLVGGDDAFFAELVQEFIASSTDTLAGWRTAVETRDLAEIGRLGHRFKSAAAMIGATSLRDHAQALEQLGKAGEASGWPEALEHVRALEQLIATLTGQLLQRLSAGAPR
jgi:CheY-like chemotaxis protein